MKKSERIRVEFGQNFMTAIVTIFPAENEAKPTMEDLEIALADAGVRFGIDKEALVRALESPFGAKTIIARGEPPKPGCDALVTIVERPIKSAPRALEDGRVDHRDLQLVKNVVKGQVLAEKEPSMPGRPGMDVRRVPLDPPPVKDPDLPVGRNTVASADGLRLLAAKDGHLVLERDRGREILSVDELFTLKSSVDMSTGNIFCIGSCLIRGGVNDGFKVTANGDITVRGQVEGAEIVSHGGSVILEQGSRGHGKGRIEAAKDIQARFIENTDVVCEGDLTVTEHIYFSRVSCRGNITILEAPGVVMGGSIAFLKQLSCRQVGAEGEPKTRVYFGDWISAEAAAEAAEIRRLIDELAEQAGKMRAALVEMRRLSLEDPDKNRERIEALAAEAQAFPRIKARIDELTEQEKSLRSRIRALESTPQADIASSLFPGVVLCGERTEEIPVKKIRRAVRIQLVPDDGDGMKFLVKPLRG